MEENENVAPSERFSQPGEFLNKAINGAKTPSYPIQEDRGYSPYQEEDGDNEQMNGWEDEDQTHKKAP